MQSSTFSPKQERELIATAESGDEAACRELVELFLPAIRGVARRFRSDGHVQRSQTLNEIGSDLGLTAERIRQIEKEALEKLREAVLEPPAAGA